MPLADAPPTAWIPGRGPDPDALARLREQFRRPHEPLEVFGPAGDGYRQIPEVMGELESVGSDSLHDALWEIAQNTVAFGRDRGRDGWYHYLLARLIPRARHQLLEVLVTGFAAQHLQRVADEPYRGFIDDALLTLGRCLMDPSEWPAPMGSKWREPRAANALGYYDLEEDFAAAGFFQAKYLHEKDIATWVVSMLDIPAPAWRANTIAWLVGMHPLLSGAMRQASELPVGLLFGGTNWSASDCLRGTNDGNWSEGRPLPPPAIPPANGAAVIAAVRSRMTVARLVQWLDSFEANPALENGLYDLPERFTALYLD